MAIFGRKVKINRYAKPKSGEIVCGGRSNIRGGCSNKIAKHLDADLQPN